MVGFMTASEAAEKWNISHRRVITLCNENRIEGVGMLGKMWIIPIDAEKPVDARTCKKNNDEERLFEVTIEETINETFNINASSIREAKEKTIELYNKQKIVLQPGELTFKALSVYDSENNIRTEYEEF